MNNKNIFRAPSPIAADPVKIKFGNTITKIVAANDQYFWRGYYQYISNLVFPNSIKEINYTDKYSANLYTVKEMKDTFDKALVGWDKYWELIPCWSLTALLNELPNGIDVIKEEADTENERYMCTIGINDDIISTFADNPVDVCVEMIEKLHNLKMLQL